VPGREERSVRRRGIDLASRCSGASAFLRNNQIEDKEGTFTVKILLVDNDPVYINLMAEVLRLHSYHTVIALDGEAALEALHKEPVDLIISDISMPRMNGINLYTHVRADERFRDTLFAWNSGYRELRDIVEVGNPSTDFKLDKAMPMPSFLYFIGNLRTRIEQQKTAAPAAAR
jgi:CheY-like chemotaxis protein